MARTPLSNAAMRPQIEETSNHPGAKSIVSWAVFFPCRIFRGLQLLLQPNSELGWPRELPHVLHP